MKLTSTTSKRGFGHRVNAWLDEPHGETFKHGKWRFWFPALVGFSILNALLTAAVFGSGGNLQTYLGAVILSVGALLAWLGIGALHYSDKLNHQLGVHIMAVRYKLLKNHGKYVATSRINLRCPECHRLGTLDTFGDIQDVAVYPEGMGNQPLLLGHRLCPNPACQLLIQVWYIYENGGRVNLLRSYPEERIDFDADNIPKPIVNALEEAITCHAQGSYFAAAIMVRKTIEELCHVQGTKGKTPQERIRDLKTKVLMPTDMLEGIDNLRLLGNDAAHVELKNFDGIGPEEIEVGILLSKELLKIVYQSSMLADRLKALKK